MIRQNVSLEPYNTFGIKASAKTFAAFSNTDQLQQLFYDPVIKSAANLLVLGGGSNVLFTKDFDGAVLKNDIQGIEILKEDAHHVWLRTGAGENWHQFVLFCIKNNFAGVENLSLIPGCNGASPMQNIGAYGVEIKDVFHSLDAYHIKDGHIVSFSNNDCAFGYRESVFKNKYKNQFVITHVTYRLRRQPVFNTSYGAIEQELEKMGVKELSVKAISDAVIRIRQSKLPDPLVVGNAGSFFKNPAIPKAQYNDLKNRYKNIPGYAIENQHMIKVPAGWLIEQCGWKGYRQGDAGIHPKQALVLVNYGNATGAEIFNLSTQVKESVMEKFGIDLEREVNII
ncbi:MAG: UDP-N-acetylmuramate dehydrogenase [Bacteroidota bacterium]